MQQPMADSSQGAAIEETRPLRILTHNVWCHYPMSFVQRCPWAMLGRHFHARLSLLADHIKTVEYDVVCIQELFVWSLWPVTDFVNGRSNFDFFRERMQECGLHHCTDPMESMGRSFGQNSGLVIFSRFPFEGDSSVDFDVTAEALNTKGFVEVLIAVSPGQKIRVVSTHLDSRSWDTKAVQIAQIADHVRGKDETWQTLVCGDLNVCPEHVYDGGEQYAYLGEQFAAAKLESLWLAERSEPTYGNHTLDHMFLQSGRWRVASKSVVKVENKDGHSVSDHYGLAAELIWNVPVPV